MTQTILLTNIAGLTHSKPDPSSLAVHDKLTLVFEPNNAYDARAVRVEHAKTGFKLGYVPKDLTTIIHEANANRLVVDAHIDAIDFDGRFPKVILRAWCTLPSTTISQPNVA